MPEYEKMSKSRGNVVLPEEVVYGVADLKEGYEFRFPGGEVIEDYKEFGVWQNPDDHCFYTATRFKRIPVFLHYKDNPVPAILNIKGLEIVQHQKLSDFWIPMLEKYNEGISEDTKV